MLTQDMNDRIARVGPGTPGGNFSGATGSRLCHLPSWMKTLCNQ